MTLKLFFGTKPPNLNFCRVRKLEHVDEVSNTERRKSNLPLPVINYKIMPKPFTVED